MKINLSIAKGLSASEIQRASHALMSFDTLTRKEAVALIGQLQVSGSDYDEVDGFEVAMLRDHGFCVEVVS